MGGRQKPQQKPFGDRAKVCVQKVDTGNVRTGRGREKRLTWKSESDAHRGHSLRTGKKNCGGQKKAVRGRIPSSISSLHFLLDRTPKDAKNELGPLFSEGSSQSAANALHSTNECRRCAQMPQVKKQLYSAAPSF